MEAEEVSSVTHDWLHSVGRASESVTSHVLPNMQNNRIKEKKYASKTTYAVSTYHHYIHSEKG